MIVALGIFQLDDDFLNFISNYVSNFPVIFVVGKPMYKIRPAEGNVMIDFAKCVAVRLCQFEMPKMMLD